MKYFCAQGACARPTFPNDHPDLIIEKSLPTDWNHFSFDIDFALL
jgi:hypothetical protein